MSADPESENVRTELSAGLQASRVGLACLRCEYDLTSVRAAECPECGTSISMMQTFLSSQADKQSREITRNAVWMAGWVPLASVVGMILLVLDDTTLVGVSGSLLTLPAGLKLVCAAATMNSFSTPIVFVSMMYRAAKPLSRQAPLQLPRRAVFAAAIAACLLAFTAYVLATVAADQVRSVAMYKAMMPMTPTLATYLELVLGWVCGILSIALSLWAFSSVARELALRLPDPALAARARRYARLLPCIAVGGAAFAGLGPLIASVLNWQLMRDLRKQLILNQDS